MVPYRDYWIEDQLQKHFKVLYSIFPSQKSKYTHIYSVTLEDRYSLGSSIAGANISFNYKGIYDISQKDLPYQMRKDYGTTKVPIRLGTCKRGKVEEFKFPIHYGKDLTLVYLEVSDPNVLYIITNNNLEFDYDAKLYTVDTYKQGKEEKDLLEKVNSKKILKKSFDLNKLVKEGKAYKVILTLEEERCLNGGKDVFIKCGKKSKYIKAGEGIPTVEYDYILKDKKTDKVVFFKLDKSDKVYPCDLGTLAKYVSQQTKENITYEAIYQRLQRLENKSKKDKEWKTLKLSDFEVKISEDQNFTEENVENQEAWKKDPKLNRKFLNNHARHGEEPGKKWTSEEKATYTLWLQARGTDEFRAVILLNEE